ncbi:lipopolysaccharide assembly protein LapA domain-containing protein [Sphingomonas solaris]|uniref:DUF1049 domain-containing protein n=1 Tax=Alterirhizorhabdus solaris TaxID=2529389 RepID=A0A558R091_9SPHN|nr:lipopolysaccharide assembly protein LapA domain-containing protein [Sphingomonas solaris]TVV72811.1 DUF1049 domain-containing protein [Sphingomonas solaris]
MQFLRTLFSVMVAVVAVIFSIRNWTTVTIHLWGGIDADVKLPVMLAIAFLIGLVPTFILHRATRWRLRRRLETAERAVALHTAAIIANAAPEDPTPPAPQAPAAYAPLPSPPASL